MKATLTFDAPESCCGEKKCSQTFLSSGVGHSYRLCFQLKTKGSMGGEVHKDVSGYTTRRHPDCPLKIREVLKSNTIDGVETRVLIPPELIQEELRWIPVIKQGVAVTYACEKCKVKRAKATPFCPSCGVKLAPPGEAT